jgi:transposase
MSTPRFTSEFKEEAARQIVDCGYPVPALSERLAVVAYSLHEWIKAVRPDKSQD